MYGVVAGLVCLLALGAPAASGPPLEYPSEAQFTEQDASRMLHVAEGALAPVYAPLAEQIAADFALGDKEGIGIDLGSGPGDLIIELCKRTKLHWVDADINPHFFPYFFEKARAAGFGHRVSAIFADAQALPFRDNYAEVLVSRGSFFAWQDKTRAFSEIYRVLKPGGVAYVGRGFARAFPGEEAEKTRGAQKKGGGDGPPKYDPEETEQELRQALDSAGIQGYRIERPAPPDGKSEINYGIWVTFRKAK